MDSVLVRNPDGEISDATRKGAEWLVENAGYELVEAAEQEPAGLSSLKKDDLIALAEEKNIEVDPKATKADLVDAIEAAEQD